MLPPLNLSGVLGVFYMVLIGVPAFILLLYFIWCIKIVEKGTAIILERFGKYHCTLGPGLHFLIPFVDIPRFYLWRHAQASSSGYLTYSETLNYIIDLRTQCRDFPIQRIITRDNVQISVHPITLFRIENPMRLCYEVYDPVQCYEKLVQTTLRSIIGDMGLDDALASRNEINRKLKRQVSEICKDWGIFVLSCELLEIEPDLSVIHAMHQQLIAERERRAAIVDASGQRERVKLLAEGNAQKLLSIAQAEMMVKDIRASAKAEAKREIATARAQCLNILSKTFAECGIKGNAVEYMLGLEYLKAFRAITSERESRKIMYLPSQFDIVGAMASK